MRLEGLGRYAVTYNAYSRAGPLVALAMTEAVLRKLGATAEQVDRERDRVRAELFGKPVQ